MGIPTTHLKRMMIFIDGGYLKKILREEFGDKIVDNPEIFFSSIESFDI